MKNIVLSLSFFSSKIQTVLYKFPTFQESQPQTALHLPSSVVRINSKTKTVDVEQLSGDEPERIALAFGGAHDMEAFSQVGRLDSSDLIALCTMYYIPVCATFTNHDLISEARRISGFPVTKNNASKLKGDGCVTTTSFTSPETRDGEAPSQK